MESDVVRLCERLRQLNDRRAELDHSLLALPEGDDEGEGLWLQLDATLVHISEVVSSLTEAPSQTSREMAAKADILALLLTPYLTDPRETSAEILRLALTVAEEMSISL
ncbi:MAG: hypothetical protein ACJ8AI_03750 [Rhodopila sp.]